MPPRVSHSLKTDWQRHALAARGYLELGMFDEAAQVLDYIAPEDNNRKEVRAFRFTQKPRIVARQRCASPQTQDDAARRPVAPCAALQRGNSHTAPASAAGARRGHPQWPSRKAKFFLNLVQQLLVRLVEANPDKSVFMFKLFADVRNLHMRHAQAPGRRRRSRLLRDASHHGGLLAESRLGTARLHTAGNLEPTCPYSEFAVRLSCPTNCVRTVSCKYRPFHFLPFPRRAYWVRRLPAPPASHVPVLALDIELLKINRFRRRTHLTGSSSVVINLPMLVSCLPFHG